MNVKSCLQTLSALLSVLCLFSLVACGTTPIASTPPPASRTPLATSGTSTTGSGSPQQATPSPATQPVPTTTTACPASGTARAAVITPMALGDDPAVVYAVNSSFGASTLSATLKVYRTRTAEKTLLLTLPGASIADEQLSANGQRVLFVVSSTGSSNRLELMRLDGQGQQTLYCGSVISFAQWSPDQKEIAFDQTTQTDQDIELLTLATGHLQTELYNAATATAASVHVQTWFDTTHLYLFGQSVDGHRNSIFLLDVNKGTNQQLQSLPPLTQKQFLDFDSSYDGQDLYIASSDCETAGCLPPGKITSQSATTPGSAQTLLADPTHAILTIRAVRKESLLYIVNNSAAPSQDTTQDGLWKMNPDGSHPTRLTNDPTYSGTHLNGQSQYSWSNVSRDQNLFVVEEDAGQAKSALVFGSLDGSHVQTFAQGDATQVLSVVGWTTLS